MRSIPGNPPVGTVHQFYGDNGEVLRIFDGTSWRARRRWEIEQPMEPLFGGTLDEPRLPDYRYHLAAVALTSEAM